MRVRLVKRRHGSYSNKKNEVIAYEAESLVNSALSGGIVASDTVSVGNHEVYYVVRSPIRINSKNGVTDVSLAGSFPLTIGYRHTTPASTLPSYTSRGIQSARADKTRT